LLESPARGTKERQRPTEGVPLALRDQLLDEIGAGLSALHHADPPDSLLMELLNAV
jgi:hypothetical protein